jgi:hypothetical protein
MAMTPAQSGAGGEREYDQYAPQDGAAVPGERNRQVAVKQTLPSEQEPSDDGKRAEANGDRIDLGEERPMVGNADPEP